jgi:hypothetical protein
MALESCHAEIGLNSRQSTSLSEVSGAQWSSLENPGERLIIKSAPTLESDYPVIGSSGRQSVARLATSGAPPVQEKQVGFVGPIESDKNIAKFFTFTCIQISHYCLQLGRIFV